MTPGSLTITGHVTTTFSDITIIASSATDNITYSSTAAISDDDCLVTGKGFLYCIIFLCMYICSIIFLCMYICMHSN